MVAILLYTPLAIRAEPAIGLKLILCRSYSSLRTVMVATACIVSRQLCCNCAHLLVDVVLPHALGESRELAFDVSGVLALQRAPSWARAVTGCAGPYVTDRRRRSGEWQGLGEAPTFVSRQVLIARPARDVVLPQGQHAAYVERQLAAFAQHPIAASRRDSQPVVCR